MVFKNTNGSKTQFEEILHCLCDFVFKVSISNMLITQFGFTLDKQEETFENNGFKESMS